MVQLLALSMASSTRILGTICFAICLSSFLVMTVAQQQNQFDQFMSELDILTRQQLAQAARSAQTPAPPTTGNAPSATTTSTTTSTTTTASPVITKKPNYVRLSGISASTVNGATAEAQRRSPPMEYSFELPKRYDPNVMPRSLRSRRSFGVLVNITVLDSFVDRSESSMILQLEIRQSWRDSRLRLRSKKSTSSSDEDEDALSDDAEEEIDQKTLTQTHLLGPEWSHRLWHPVSRLVGSGQLTNPSVNSDQSPQGKPSSQASQPALNFKPLEQENNIQSIVVHSNFTSARVFMSLKVRIKLPMYECQRDSSKRYPFDRITCKVSIANAHYDHKQLNYDFGAINWHDNGHRTGEFYLRNLQHSLGRDRIVDLDPDVSNSEHSSIQLELNLARQIGDYILNVYLLHLFLLALCLSSFWLSIDAIIIRLALSIIVLVIIKFQTIQNMKDDRRIVSALSIWTFGTSCLVIVAILAHILSYYSNLNDFNTKIQQYLFDHKKRNDVEMASSHAEPSRQERTSDDANESSSNNNNSSSTRSESTAAAGSGRHLKLELIKKQFHALLMRWLNWTVATNSTETLPKANIVDIISRWTLSVLYLTFVGIYFVNFVI